MLNSEMRFRPTWRRLQVLDRPRLHVGDVDRLAGLGVGDQQLVGVLVLQVVVRSDGLGAGREQRDGR